ncbi:MAG TPA: hypothetical protein VF432_33160 [Thermoanaerobaculia bacterium]
MIGKPLMLKTDLALSPSVVSGYSSLQQTLHTLLESNQFGSTLYKTLAGGPKLCWFIPFDGVIDAAQFPNPFDSARATLANGFADVTRTVQDTVQHVSSQVLVLDKAASHGEPAAPTFLYETRLAFAPAGAFHLHEAALTERFAAVFGGQQSNGLAGYAYKTLISPVFDWYVAFENLADLDAALRELHQMLAEATQLRDFFSTVTSIESCILKKVIEK